MKIGDTKKYISFWYFFKMIHKTSRKNMIKIYFWYLILLWEMYATSPHLFRHLITYSQTQRVSTHDDINKHL